MENAQAGFCFSDYFIIVLLESYSCVKGHSKSPSVMGVLVEGTGVLLRVKVACVLYFTLHGVFSVREDLIRETFSLFSWNHCSSLNM